MLIIYFVYCAKKIIYGSCLFNFKLKKKSYNQTPGILLLGKVVIYKIIPGTESKHLAEFCFRHFDRFTIRTLVAAIPRSVQVSDGLSSETGND